MKNKRNVLIAFILICCLCLSIGYAALADELHVTGGAALKVVSGNGETPTPWEENFMEGIKFTAVGDLDKNVTAFIGNETNSGTGDDGEGDLLTISVPGGVLTPDKKSTTITATITNSSMYSAVITSEDITTEYTDTYFTVTAAVPNGSATLNANGGTTTLTITVTVKDDAFTTALTENVSTNILITIRANVAE